MNATSLKRNRLSPTQTVDKYMTSSPHTIGSDQTLATAHKLMREYGIRHLPVLEAGKLVGVLSDRDLKLIETLKGVDQLNVSVSEAMTPEVFQVAPLASVETTAREMGRHKYGSAIVVENERVVGIFTAVDALQGLAWLLDQRKD